jgi:hypothetical protein
METLSSVFSSLQFKKEKAFVEKEQKFMYVPKVSVPKPHHVFKIGKNLVQLRVTCRLNHLRGLLKCLVW